MATTVRTEIAMAAIKETGVRESEIRLGTFAADLGDLRPFWAQLGESLATETQSRWPLRKRSGRLRRSLRWAGSRLAKGGIFESSPDRLAFGSSIFNSRFHQYGAKHTPRRPLIHVDEKQHTDQLTTWLQDRAKSSGLEVNG